MRGCWLVELPILLALALLVVSGMVAVVWKIVGLVGMRRA
jgi:hypothetical protein